MLNLQRRASWRDTPGELSSLGNVLNLQPVMALVVRARQLSSLGNVLNLQPQSAWEVS